MASLGVVRCHVERGDADALEAARAALHAAELDMPSPPAISLVERAFQLSPFERDVLLLCAGAEIDAAIGAACAAILGDPQRLQPTFSLALAVLPAPHWSAIAPGSPLRRHLLLELGPGDGPARSPLRIQERVLHHLAGVDQLDERLTPFVEPARFAATAQLGPAHKAIAERIAGAWRAAVSGDSATEGSPSKDGPSAAPAPAFPTIELRGPGRSAKPAIAAAACAASGLRLDVIRAEAPAAQLDDERVVRLLVRDALLRGSAFLLDAEDFDEERDAPRSLAARRFAERGACPMLVAVRGRDHRAATRALAFDVERVPGADRPSTDLAGLAERLESKASWGDLVLPEPQRAELRDIGVHVRRRAHLQELWGFAEGGARGMGVNALFAGPSGTGKTLAAEVLARELGLVLYRVDLSRVISKYIGDTEKNLRRVFDAAEDERAVLLFDEADALFGPRSDVKDSHDRYANVEVAYLLQRMESYRGVSILTTNMRETLDPSFSRRLRFIVDFPFPGAELRAEIWRRVFPKETPLEDLEIGSLARWNVTGGDIRNIAVASASLAVEEGSPVTMAHLRRAARTEYRKLGRPFPADAGEEAD